MSQDLFAFMMNDLTRVLRRQYEEHCRKLGVSRPQWRVLLMLSQSEGVSQARLADALSMEHITLCRIIDQLAAAGWVERRTDPADRRVRRLFILPEGRPVIERMRAVDTDIHDRALAGLPEQTRTLLITALERIYENVAGAPIVVPEHREAQLADLLS